MQQKAEADVPHCVRNLGTISIVDGDDPSGWTQYNLAPPQKLLKVMVQRSGCFNLVDRDRYEFERLLRHRAGPTFGLLARGNTAHESEPQRRQLLRRLRRLLRRFGRRGCFR